MLAGPLPASLATTYATYPLTQASFKSANYSFVAMKDLLRVTENEIALCIGNNEKHLWRTILADETVAIVPGGTIPAVGASGAPVIGLPGGVNDASNGKPLENNFTFGEIRALNENPGSWRKIDVYEFDMIYPQIQHTRTSVKVDVCVWDPDDCDTAIAANDDLLFPDAEGAYVSGLGSKMGNLDPQFAALAATFAPEYTAWLTALSAGDTKPGGKK